MIKAYDKPAFKNADNSIGLGLALLAGGLWLLWDGYERRGRRRPFLLRFTTPSP